MKQLLHRVRRAYAALTGPEPLESSITNCYVKGRSVPDFVISDGGTCCIRLDRYAIIPLEEFSGELSASPLEAVIRNNQAANSQGIDLA